MTELAPLPALSASSIKKFVWTPLDSSWIPKIPHFRGTLKNNFPTCWGLDDTRHFKRSQMTKQGAMYEVLVVD